MQRLCSKLATDQVVNVMSIKVADLAIISTVYSVNVNYLVKKSNYIKFDSNDWDNFVVIVCFIPLSLFVITGEIDELNNSGSKANCVSEES